MKTLTVPATVDQLETVLQAITGELSRHNCPPREQMQIEMAIEEILVNISNYAYRSQTGDATVQWEMTSDPLRITISFIDSGQPFNPLEKEDPDTSLPAEDREIGGLGIFLVKQIMDAVSYEYRDGRNILTIEKVLQPAGA